MIPFRTIKLHFITNTLVKLFIIAVVVNSLISSCSNQKAFQSLDKFKPAQIVPVSELSMNLCTLDPKKAAALVGVLALIDITGSNADRIQNDTLVQGNDNDKKFRYDTYINYMIEEIASAPNLDNKSFAYLQFADGSPQRMFLNDIDYGDEMAKAVSPFKKAQEHLAIVQSAKAREDVNGTPYVSVLGRGKDTIEKDARILKKYYEDNPNETIKKKSYVVFMLTDGRPCSTDGSGGVFSNEPDFPAGCPTAHKESTPHNPIDINGDGVNDGVEVGGFFIANGVPHVHDINTQLILSKIKEILDLSNLPDLKPYIGTITVNTGFYNIGADPNAEDLLKKMADEGKGEFANFNNGQTPDFRKLTYVRTTKNPFLIDSWFIENKSVIFDRETKKWEKDTDMDGVPDRLEIPAYCAFTNDCDEDGVRDNVEYAVNFPSAVCDEIRKDAQGIDKCVVSSSVDLCFNADGSERDTDSDFLRDCEELILGTILDKPDSNNDKVPDGRAFQENYTLKEPDQDNENIPFDPVTFNQDQDICSICSDMDEIVHLTPWDVNNTLIPGINPLKINYLDYTFNPLEQISCNEIEFKDLPIIEGIANKIRVTVLDRAKFQTVRFLRTIEVLIPPGQKTFRITSEDFKLHEIKVQ